MIVRVCFTLMLCLCMVFATCLYAGDAKHMASSPATKIPGVRVLKTISNTYTPITFDHPKHAAIAGNCAACHHHGNGDTASCKGCHKLKASAFRSSVVQNFMPCSNCHGAADRENPALPGLKVAYHKKCFECHRGMGDIGLNPTGCTAICHAKKVQEASKIIRQ